MSAGRKIFRPILRNLELTYGTYVNDVRELGGHGFKDCSVVSIPIFERKGSVLNGQ